MFELILALTSSFILLSLIRLNDCYNRMRTHRIQMAVACSVEGVNSAEWGKAIQTVSIKKHFWYILTMRDPIALYPSLITDSYHRVKNRLDFLK